MHEGKLYVLGGLTPEGSSDDVHVYDLAAGIWSKGPSLPKDNLTICAATYRDRLYANGADGTVESYDPSKDAWTTLSEALPLDAPKQLRAFAYGDQLLLYTANLPSQAVQVALLDPALLGSGEPRFVKIAAR